VRNRAVDSGLTYGYTFDKISTLYLEEFIIIQNHNWNGYRRENYGMTDISYNVVFSGTVKEGVNFIETKNKIAKLFRLKPGEAEQWLSGNPKILKKNTDLETAKKYKLNIEKAGAVCQILRNSETKVTPSKTNKNEGQNDGRYNGVMKNLKQNFQAVTGRISNRKNVNADNQVVGNSLKFENILFRFTRLIAIGGAGIAFISLLVLVLSLILSGSPTYVHIDDISKKISSDSSVSEAVSKSKSSIHIPNNVKRHLSGKNEAILQGWLNTLSNDDQKQDFVDNLSDVISDAESKNLKVTDIINNYKTIKLSKIRESGVEQYKELGKKVAVSLAIFGLIIFISLMSLILVMLAIERNTRNERTMHEIRSKV